MALHTISFGKFLERGLPLGFMPQLLDKLASAYDIAHKAGRVSTDASEAPHMLLPFLEQERLADDQGRYTQNFLHRFAGDFPGLQVGVGANSRKREYVHVKSTCILLTSHRVGKPGALPPSADYREQNAHANWFWLPTMAQENSSNSDFVYLYLLHGPTISDKTELGFVQLGAPSPDGKGYIALHNIYRHSDYSIIRPEEIKDEATISLKADFLKKLRDE